MQKLYRFSKSNYYEDEDELFYPPVAKRNSAYYPLFVTKITERMVKVVAKECDMTTLEWLESVLNQAFEMHEQKIERNQYAKSLDGSDR